MSGSNLVKGRRAVGSRSFHAILKTVTGFVVLLWLLAVLYFLIYPLLPSYQSFRSHLHNYDPYEIGYSATAQLLVSISPPVYDLETDTSEDSRGISGGKKSMEYVDPTTVELAGLESLDTKITINAASIHGNIVDGYTPESMMEGFWHYPHSSTPGARGNTIVFGHRFHKLPPNRETFFNLDDVVIGDKVVVTQHTGETTYTVVKTHVVDKFDEDVLRQTGDYRLTLITCTPLWTSDKRLVVVAIQDKVSSVI